MSSRSLHTAPHPRPSGPARWTGAPRSALALALAAGVVAVLAVAVVVPSPSVARSAAPVETSLAISVRGSTLVVSGSGCAWAEGTSGPPSSVHVVVAVHLEGSGQVGAPEPLADVRVQPATGGGWSSVLPRLPLLGVPDWADARVVVAEAHCAPGIGNGFDYAAASHSYPLTHPPATGPADPALSAPPPASAVHGASQYTG